MKRLAFVSVMLASILGLAPRAASADICSLASSTDSFGSTEGSGRIPTPFGPLPFFVCGPTTITRGSPTANGDGSCTIPTEIVSMTLTGVFDPCGPFSGPIRIVEDPGIMSTGAITSNTAGDLPATSFFDVYTRIDIPSLAIAGMAHTVHVDAYSEKLGGIGLNHLPPGAATPGGEECVEPGDDYYAAGYPDDHEHIPCPPKGCCQLECGRIIKVSPRTCHRFNGIPVDGCVELCQGQPTPAKTRSWGSLKVYYR